MALSTTLCIYKADETGHLREPFPPRYHILACTSYPYLQLLYGTVMVLVGHNYVSGESSLVSSGERHMQNGSTFSGSTGTREL